MTTPSQPPTGDSLVLSYLDLRKAIGIIGIALPIMLIVGKYIIEGPGTPGSISTYYHTDMRDVLVGSLCAIGVFLLSYRGYGREDNIAGDLACIFAVGVALFPASPDWPQVPTPSQETTGTVHYLFAAALFLTLAYFCLKLFRKGTGTPTPKKLVRNKLYTACGYTMLACIVLIGVTKLLPPDSPTMRIDPVFWLEAFAIWAFGISWFTKGEGIFGD
ncbi:MAG: DUF998 domain-containing protein [Ignavibacteriae bacterium]|nr:DUF998 domain-containing protein [Ignavibacteriota bacterium]